MEESILKCTCGKTFQESEFINHFKNCNQFKDEFKNFDSKVIELIKPFTNSIDNLKILKFLLNAYNEKIGKKLVIKENIIKNKTDNSANNNLNICQNCKTDKDLIKLDCNHLICQECFRNKVIDHFFEVIKCSICNFIISEQFQRNILKEFYEDIISIYSCFEPNNSSLVRCPKCKGVNKISPSENIHNIRDKNLNFLSKELAEHYIKNRCLCNNCQTDFCIICLSIPYHLGRRCDEYICIIRHYKKCRYCDTEINEKKIGPDDDVCNSSECKERYSISCKKRLPCGHKCLGVNGEKICPPCLDRECKEFDNKYGQEKDCFCFICYTEGLGGAPIVQASCGHCFHYQCIKKLFEEKLNTPTINFYYCLCPNCDKWFDIDSIPYLQKMINDNKILYEKMKQNSLKLIKLFKLDKDPRLLEPKSPWYGKKIEYALERISYYRCYECKEPYFAGIKECGKEPKIYDHFFKEKYSSNNYVCNKHIKISNIKGINNCSKHGKDYLEYKCKFCCNKANLCHNGNTHFCDNCFEKKGKTEMKYYENELSGCNKSICESGGNHPPNGEEFALGCLICKYITENNNEF